MVAIEIVQQKLFKLSDSERAEKVEQLLGAPDEREHLIGEKKAFIAGIKDQMEDVEARIAGLREDLGVPESHLGPQMTAARDEERKRHE